MTAPAPPKLREMVSLFRDAFRLVWRTSRPRTALLLGSRVWPVLAGGLVVVLTRDAIAGLVHRSGPVTPGVLFGSAAVVGLVGLTGLISSVSMDSQTKLLGLQVNHRVTRALIDVTTRVPLKTFDEPVFFERLARIQSSGFNAPLQATQAVIGFVSGAAGLAVVLLALLVVQPLLVPVLLLGLLPLAMLSRRSMQSFRALMLSQLNERRLSQHLIAILTRREHAAELRAFGYAAELNDRLERLHAEFLAGQRKLAWRQAGIQVLEMLVLTATIVGWVAVVAVLHAHGQVSVAELGAAVVAVPVLAARLGEVGGAVGRLTSSAFLLDDVREFRTLSHEPASEASPAPGVAHLRAERLWFTYPGARRPALCSVDLEIRPGQVVALVGENGSGKSTLAKVLAHLYAPDCGRLEWNGISTLGDPAHWRSATALVPQDFGRYQLTAHDNLGLGLPAALPDRDRIRAAAGAAGIDALLSELPHGYDTMLSNEWDEGVDLSVGQWQRIALARAFLRDTPLIILDEPTASLDPRAEHELFEQVRELLHGRSVLLISHRLWSVCDADRIYVLHEGEVVESGNHQQLMDQQGQYWEMFNLQSAAYRQAATAPPVGNCDEEPPCSATVRPLG